MADGKTTASFPVAGVLGLIFITLKLCHVIDWSWWWVLAPFWIPIALVAVICGVAVGVPIIVGIITMAWMKWEERNDQ